MYCTNIAYLQFSEGDGWMHNCGFQLWIERRTKASCKIVADDCHHHHHHKWHVLWHTWHQFRVNHSPLHPQGSFTIWLNITCLLLILMCKVVLYLSTCQVCVLGLYVLQQILLIYAFLQVVFWFAIFYDICDTEGTAPCSLTFNKPTAASF